MANELREEVSRQRARMDSVANELRSALAKQEVLLNTIRPTTAIDDNIVEIPQPVVTRIRRHNIERLTLPPGLVVGNNEQRLSKQNSVQRNREFLQDFNLPAFVPLPLQGRAWGPEQATGAPNTATAGDQQTAWASRTQDGQPEWLVLEYDHPVTITKYKLSKATIPARW